MLEYSPLIVSLKTAAVATVFAFSLGLVAASKVRKLTRYRGIVDGIFILPMVLPPTVVGFFLLLLLGKKSFLGKILSSMDYSIIFSWEATVIAATVVAFPLMYRTTLSAFDQVDESLLFAAQTLGMSEYCIFWKIICPNSMAGIIGGTILAFARALGEFGATMMIAGNIKGKTQTLAMAVYTAVQNGDRGTAYLWTIVITIISFTMIILMNHFNHHQKLQKMR